MRYTPDEDTEDVCDAAQHKEQKHEQGQPFCSAAAPVLVQLGQPGPHIGGGHDPP